MANAPKKGAVPRAVSVAAPVEAVAATVSAVLPIDTKLPATPAEEIQQSFRSALEKGVVDSRAAFAKAKTAADETASALAIHAKAFEALRINAEANFDFLKAVFGAKSLPDLITLQTEFARKQVETITGQTKDFGALTQKAVADAVEPIKEQVARSFKLAV